MIDSLAATAAHLAAFNTLGRQKAPDTHQDHPDDFRTLLGKTPTKEKQNPTEIIKTPESTRESLHIYLPGIMGSEKGMAPIYDELEKTIADQFPNAEFIGKNSLISEDFPRRPDGDRYVELSRKVSEALSQGQDIYLYGHSLGAVEVTQILKRLKLLQPGLWREGKGADKIHVVLMSPAGFGKNIRQIAQGVRRLKDVTFAGAELSGHIYGLETFAYLPLKKRGSNAESMEAADMQTSTDLLTKFFPEMSQLGEYSESDDANEIDQELMAPSSEKLEARLQALTPEERAELQGIDDQIHLRAEQGDTARIQDLVKQRGRILSKYSQRLYAGNVPERVNTSEALAVAETEETQKFPWSAYAQAMLGMGRLIGGVLTGNTYREMKSWKDKGVDISFLIPEFDVLVKVSEIEDFIGEDENLSDRAVMLRSTTHSSSSVETSVLASSIQRFAEQLAKRNKKREEQQVVA